MGATHTVRAALLVVLAAAVLAGCGGHYTPRTANSPWPPRTSAPAPAPVAQTVARVDTVSDVVLTDGRTVRLTSPAVGEACDDAIRLPVARELLVGEQVYVVNQGAGTGPDIRLVDGTSYYSALTSRTASDVVDQCYLTSTPTTSATPDEGGDVYVSGDDDHESRYCRRHRFIC